MHRAVFVVAVCSVLLSACSELGPLDGASTGSTPGTGVTGASGATTGAGGGGASGSGGGGDAPTPTHCTKFEWEGSLPKAPLGTAWASAADDVWAIGSDGDQEATILHFDGASWSPVSSGSTANLRDMWGS